MINAIIIDKEFKFISRIVNLIYSIDNIKLKSIYLSFDKTLSDNFNNPDNVYIMTETTYYKYLGRFPKNIKLIVFLNSMIKAKANNDILYISSKIADVSIMKNIISFLKLDTNEQLANKLYKILRNFKFDFSIKGTNYLYESILYSITERKDYICENLEGTVFSVIAEKYNTTVGNIKWSIVRSINKTLKETPPSNLKAFTKYFHLDNNVKITPKLLICLFTNKFVKT